MSIAEELTRLEELRQRGTLSDSEFAQAKAKLLAGETAPPAAPIAAINAFRRSRSDRWIGGVCGGLGKTTGLESWIWRLIFVLLTAAGGISVLTYLALWIFVPEE